VHVKAVLLHICILHASQPSPACRVMLQQTIALWQHHRLAQNTMHQRHMRKTMTQVCRAYCSTAEVAQVQHFTQSASSDTRRASQTTDIVSGCSMASKRSTYQQRKLFAASLCDVMFVQVGWRRSGLAVWSASGCRLMCSLRQTARPNTFTPLSAASSSAFATDSHKQNALPMEVSDCL